MSKRTKTLQLRVTPEEKAALEAAAIRHDRTLSSLMMEGLRPFIEADINIVPRSLRSEGTRAQARAKLELYTPARQQYLVASGQLTQAQLDDTLAELRHLIDG